MKKILIIGGGLSGLSSAVHLTEMGFQVEIIEASPKLGGRAYSFNYSQRNDILDNGQHILMGCYSHTLEYIDKIKSRDQFYSQDSLHVNYVSEDNRIYTLSVAKNFYPFNFLYSFINFNLLSFNERIEILKFFFRLNAIQKKIGSNETVKDILMRNGQSISTIKKFWNLIVISAMNTPIEIASAELFVEMIKIIFFSGKKSSTIILPGSGLSEALVYPASKLILNRGGEISLSERVDKIETIGKRITKVFTSKREIDNFDLVISTIPADNLVKIIPDEFTIRMNIPSFEYSPIISVNLWYDKNPLKEKFYGIIDGEFHWLFNKGDYISLIKSAANNIANLNKNEIIETAISEMKKYFPILNNIEIIDSKIIKERKATIISSSISAEQRKKLNHNFSNLFIAGDWVNTGLPSTIESSIKSGKKISELILSQ